MIKQKLSMFALSAFAAVALTATSANATTYTTTDLLLGFRSGGSETSSYIVNLGNNSQFRNSDGTAYTGSAFDVTIGGLTTGALNTDLTTVFGPNWSTRLDLYWGIVGAIFPATSPDRAQTVYLTSAAVTAGQSTALINTSAGSQGAWRTKIAEVGSAYLMADSNTANAAGLIQSNASDGSWASQLGGSNTNYAWGSAFTTGKAIEASVGSGNVLDLYRLVPTGAGIGAPGSFNVGTFSLNSAGTVSFAAVPEPSTYALIALTGILYFFVNKRRKANS